MKQEKEENEKDDIDKYIESILNKKISEPEGFEKAIREALYTEKFDKRLRKRKIIRTISTACATVILTSGVTIGGFIAYEKIWKEPKQYTYEELKNTIADTGVSEEEKKELISEEQAKQTALEIAKNLGYENEQIESIELKQNKEEEYESTYYLINTNNSNKENLNMRVDAKTGELVALENREVLSEQRQLDNITEQEAKKISNVIYKSVIQELYEFYECKQEEVVYNGTEVDVWIAKYYKMYNDLINPYEEVKIEFFKDDNKIKICSIKRSNNGIYENNPQVISEDEAIRIAVDNEKKLTNNEISDVNAKKGIRKMNNYFFELDKNINELNNVNESESNFTVGNNKYARNVWIVAIEHKGKENETIEEYLKGKDKEYYVDISTGEILGGKKLEK